MKKTIQIAIPKPCHEDWNKMTPVEKGRHCTICSKNVVDFTKHSNEQLIKHLEKEKNLCGRFKKNQLNKEITLERKDKNSLVGYATSTFFAFLTFGNYSTQAQEKPKTEQTSKQFISLGISNKNTEEKKETIRVTGTINDQSEPLPGVNIIIKGTTNGTVTDFDGNYLLDVKIGDTLQVSYIGYINQEIIITKKIIYNIILNEDIQLLLGELTYLVKPKPKRLFYKNPFLYRRWYK